jgi:hypothetical protein
MYSRSAPSSTHSSSGTKECDSKLAGSQARIVIAQLSKRRAKMSFSAPAGRDEGRYSTDSQYLGSYLYRCLQGGEMAEMPIWC